MILLKIDPNVVRPGWIALLIVIALAVVVCFLVWSMRRQVRRIRLPHEAERSSSELAEQDAEQQTSADSATSASTVDGSPTFGGDEAQRAGSSPAGPDR